MASAHVESDRSDSDRPAPRRPYVARGLGDRIFRYQLTARGVVVLTGTPLIALHYGDDSPFGMPALMAAGLALFLLTLAVNFTASSVVARSRSGAQSEA
ncbi:hypothetical protein [Streptomyces mirabilis]|uniref:hypothetical protein n=1 Tax=Streptomyces mirabilis TaxID=68239 RepID=UPI0037227386